MFNGLALLLKVCSFTDNIKVLYKYKYFIYYNWA